MALVNQRECGSNVRLAPRPCESGHAELLNALVGAPGQFGEDGFLRAKRPRHDLRVVHRTRLFRSSGIAR